MIITSLYGLPTVKHSSEHKKRLQAAIDYLGKKYILATHIKKVEN
jgi:hypothetical protein